jgi:hypothetical protein
MNARMPLTSTTAFVHCSQRFATVRDLSISLIENSATTATDRRALRSFFACLYCACILCFDRQRAQTFALSLNYDRGDATESWRASPPRSGKPDGPQAFPLEPRVQGRFASIVMAEDAFKFCDTRTMRDAPKPAQSRGFFLVTPTASLRRFFLAQRRAYCAPSLASFSAHTIGHVTRCVRARWRASASTSPHTGCHRHAGSSR